MWLTSTNGHTARLTAAGLATGLALLAGGAAWAQEPDRIFDKSTVWRPLTPNDKLVVYGIDDPAVAGVACWYTQPEKGGIKGTLGLAEDVSDISLACRQVGPVQFKDKVKQGEVVFSERRSLIFKSMQIVRGCDTKRNTLIYMVYSDKVVQGSPKNSTSSVPLAPWGTEPPPKCADFLK
ncbi:MULTISPECIES: CreA family protein [unclassified Methylobacterium]|uniref:CreA family protein n=1 Tax=unclassified Methylobacterium TaxID=2615210 RepID=UPI0036F80BC6